MEEIKALEVINISFWAIPSEPLNNYYQNKIERLAKKYHSMTYLPHITIYTGISTLEESLDILSTCTNKSPIMLHPISINVSRELSKTFFISYQNNSALQSICKNIRFKMKNPSNYAVDPHMSLLYKLLKDEEYVRLADCESIKLFPIKIDEICIVHTPMPFVSPDEIADWKIIHCKKLRT